MIHTCARCPRQIAFAAAARRRPAARDAVIAGFGWHQAPPPAGCRAFPAFGRLLCPACQTEEPIMIAYQTSAAMPIEAPPEPPLAERMARTMRELRSGGRTVDAEALAEAGYTSDEIDATWRMARDLANAETRAGA